MSLAMEWGVVIAAHPCTCTEFFEQHTTELHDFLTCTNTHLHEKNLTRLLKHGDQ